MKLAERVKRLFTIWLSKWVKSKENPLDIMRKQLEDAKGVMREVEDSIAHISAKRKLAEQDLGNYQIEADRYQKALDLAAKQNDVITGSEALIAVQQYDRHINSLQEHIGSLTVSEDNLEQQLSIFKSKYSAQAREFRMYESQAQYADTVGKVNDHLRDTFSKDEFSSFNSLARELREKVAFEQSRNDRLMKTDRESLEHKSAVAAFEAYAEQKRLGTNTNTAKLGAGE